MEQARQVYDEDDFKLITYRNDLMGSYFAARKMAKVAPIMEEITSYLRENYGDDNPQTLIAMGNLAHVYFVIGEVDQAIAKCQLMFDLASEHMVPNSMEVRYGARTLGRMKMSVPQYESARPVVEDWLRSMNETTGFDVPNEWPDVYACMAEIELNDGNVEKAVELANKGLGYREEDSNTIFFRVESVLAATLGKQEKFEEAEGMLLEAHVGLAEKLEELGGASRWYATRICEFLIELYQSTDDEENVAKWETELNRIQAEIESLRRKEISE